MAKPITKAWKPEDVQQLLSLAESGATLLRAAAALGRRTTSVRRKANELGKSFPGVRKVRADLRASGAVVAANSRSTAG